MSRYRSDFDFDRWWKEVRETPSTYDNDPAPPPQPDQAPTGRWKDNKGTGRTIEELRR